MGNGGEGWATGLMDTAQQVLERAPGSAHHSLRPPPKGGLQNLSGPSVKEDGVSPPSPWGSEAALDELMASKKHLKITKCKEESK